MAQLFINPVSGQDVNPGSFEYPFKTAQRALNAFSTGDEVFGYGGSTISEEIQVNKHGFNIKHYGPSEKIKWNSFVSLTSWVSIGGGLYECTHSSLLETVMVLKIDGVKTPKGRFPEKNDVDGGFIITTANTAQGFLQSSHLVGMPNFVGAEVVIRTSGWTQNRARIDTQAGEQITFTYVEKPSYYSPYPPSENYGFFFQNDIKCLTKFGDWMYNPTSKKVTMYFGSELPSNYNIQVSSKDRLIHQLYGINDLLLEDIEFSGCNSNPVEAYGGDGYMVDRCIFENLGRNGVWASNHTGVQVQNSEFETICNSGIWFAENCHNSIIHRNTFKDIGLDNGAYRNEGDQATGISATSDNTMITYNTLENIGYNGIRWGGNTSKCKYNSAINVCLRLDDGAGIYTRGNGSTNYSNRECTNNFVKNSVGYRFGTEYDGSGTYLAHCFYGDDWDNGTLWQYNTAEDATGRAYYFHNARNIVVLNNKAINCGWGIYFQTETTPRTRNIILKQNVIVCKDSSQKLLALHSIGASDLNLWVVNSSDFDLNAYYHPNPTINLVRTQDGGSNIDRTFSDWKSYLGLDTNSQINPVIISNQNQWRLEKNISEEIISVNLDGTYVDYTGTPVSSPISIDSYTSKLLIKTGEISDLKNISVGSTFGGTVTGAGTYPNGQPATLTANPNTAENYVFKRWEEAGQFVTSNNPYTFIVSVDRTLMAIFERENPDPSPDPEFRFRGRFLFYTFDPDYQAVLDVAQTNSIAIPPSSIMVAQDQLMRDMKDIGFFQIQDTFANFALGIPGFEQFRMIDWKKVGNIYTPVDSPIFTPQGVEGDGVAAYINTNFNPFAMGVNYTLQNAGRGTVVTKTTSDPLSPSNLIDGNTVANNINTFYNLTSNAQRINNGNVLLPSEVDMSGPGYKAINRDFSSLLFYNKNTEHSRTQPSTVISDAEQLILSRGDGRCSSIGVSLYYMGASTPYTVSQSFRTIYNQFLSNVGLEPIA